MLRTAAPFPHAGSTAYLRPHAIEVRIIRHNPDGSALISLAATRDHPEYGREASGMRTVPMQKLAGSAMAAIGTRRARSPQAA